MNLFRFAFNMIILAIFALLAYGGYAYYQSQNGSFNDLGVKYSINDYKNAVEKKLKIKIADKDEMHFGITRLEGKGSQRVDQKFNNSEVSAVINYTNQKYGPFKDVQIKLSEGGKIEMSAWVSAQVWGLDYYGPILARGTLRQAGNQTFGTTIDYLSAGKYVFPKFIRENMNHRLMIYTNNLLATLDDFEIETWSLESGYLRFLGTIPQEISGK